MGGRVLQVNPWGAALALILACGSRVWCHIGCYKKQLAHGWVWVAGVWSIQFATKTEHSCRVAAQTHCGVCALGYKNFR